jgi:hypothetical protein
MAQPTLGRADRLFAEGMDVTEQEVNRRKEFLEFRQEDSEALKSLKQVAEQYADPVIDDLYRHFLSFDETRAFFRDPKVLERVKRLQKERLVNELIIFSSDAHRRRCHKGAATPHR